MAVGAGTRAKRKKPLRRPRKSESKKKQRLKVHQRRLVALGMSQEKVAALSLEAIRELLKRPKKTAAQNASG